MVESSHSGKVESETLQTTKWKESLFLALHKNDRYCVQFAFMGSHHILC